MLKKVLYTSIITTTILLFLIFLLSYVTDRGLQEQKQWCAKNHSPTTKEFNQLLPQDQKRYVEDCLRLR